MSDQEHLTAGPSNEVVPRPIKKIAHFPGRGTLVFYYEDGGERLDRVRLEPEDDEEGPGHGEMDDELADAAPEKLEGTAIRRSIDVAAEEAKKNVSCDHRNALPCGGYHFALSC